MTRKPVFIPTRFLTLLASVCTLVLVALSMGPFIGGLHWVLDLTAHFVCFYAVTAFVGTLYFTIVRAWRWMAVAAILLLLNVGQIVPWYVGAPSSESEGPTLSILMANVHTSNKQHEEFVALIREMDPDVFIAQEIDQDWVDSLAGIGEDYPHQLLRPRGDNFGMGLYSKVPLTNARTEQFGAAPVRVILADIEQGGHALSLIALHTLPPIGGKYSTYRDSQLAAIGEHVRNSRYPTLLIGDLNITMWSPHMKQMARESGLMNARKGRGIQATWPTFNGPFRIPIDHCLYEEPLAVPKFEVTAPIGSDHLPIWVQVQLAPTDNGD